MPWHLPGGQGTALRRWLSPSTTWDRGSNSGGQTWRQVPLPAEPSSHWLGEHLYVDSGGGNTISRTRKVSPLWTQTTSPAPPFVSTVVLTQGLTL